MLWLCTSDGQTRQIVLKPMAVAEFYAEYRLALSELGVAVTIDGIPNELPDPIPFDRDTVHAAYDRDYANRFWRVLLRSHEVFSYFRTAFLGKASPVHFFWGRFRSRGDAVLGQAGAAASGRRSAPARRRGPGSLFA